MTILRDYKGHKMYDGKANLEFGGSPLDPLYKIPIKDILG